MHATWFDRTLLVVALTLTVAFLFVPVFLVSYHHSDENGTLHVTETTVGIGVVLRAAVRRLFRTGGRNLLETALGTFTRTTARAITRRVVRVAVKAFAVVVKGTIQEARAESGAAPPTSQHPAVAVLLGFVALYLSLWGILALIPSRQATALLEGETPGPQTASITPQSEATPTRAGLAGRVSLPLAALLGATPLLCYALLIWAAASWGEIPVRFQTGADGLLLQAYFTGGTSFLPLTTDVEYRGSPRANAGLAAVTLGGMFLIHLVLNVLAHTLDSYALAFAATMFLLYCFVYSFPIRPLDGQYLWAQSKWLWLAFWVPVLISFVVTVPESFNAIL